MASPAEVLRSRKTMLDFDRLQEEFDMAKQAQAMRQQMENNALLLKTADFKRGLQNDQREQDMFNQKLDFEREMMGTRFANEQALLGQRAAQEKELLKLRMAQLGGVNPDTGEPVYSTKPLPAPALKMQGDALDSYSAAKNTSDLAAKWIKEVDAGNVNLGPASNFVNATKNFLGYSTPSSRNYAMIDTDLEKLRNDTLRLNKGVQTEGDAERAMNEVIKNRNDPKLFRQSMERLVDINNRAALLQQQRVDDIRSNYNVAPYDYSQIPSAGQGDGATFLGFE